MLVSSAKKQGKTPAYLHTKGNDDPLGNGQVFGSHACFVVGFFYEHRKR